MRSPSLAEHLNPVSGPKRILALDGGGLRGVLTLGILAELEAQLRQRHGDDPAFRLSDYFDLIAGTSTGAIIAAALALGMTVAEVLAHYQALGEAVFKRNPLRLGVLRAKYDAAKVQQALQGVFGERKLSSPDLRTGLLVMTKRLDTGSPWPITNNPNARYFRAGTQASTIGNGDYPLWQVVRASTAAPSFFDPETIQIGLPADGHPAVTGDFVDGGVSPANNPALQALMAATMAGYQFNWSAGAQRLQLVSVGTGKADAALGHAGVLQSAAAVHALLSLQALMDDCADQVEAVLQWLSVSPTARQIDREMQQAQPPLGGQALCSYLRYNVLLDSAWVSTQLGETRSAEQLKAMEAMDDPSQMQALHQLGLLAGRKLVLPEHFCRTFDLPLH